MIHRAIFISMWKLVRRGSKDHTTTVPVEGHGDNEREGGGASWTCWSWRDYSYSFGKILQSSWDEKAEAQSGWLWRMNVLMAYGKFIVLPKQKV